MIMSNLSNTKKKTKQKTKTKQIIESSNKNEEYLSKRHIKAELVGEDMRNFAKESTHCLQRTKKKKKMRDSHTSIQTQRN